MQTTHTPGMWHAQHWSCHAATTVGTTDAEGNFVEIAECAVPGLSTDQRIANARLIAAAPDLLDALRDFVSAADGAYAQGATTVSVAEASGWLLQARAAIAKATQASAAQEVAAA